MVDVCLLGCGGMMPLPTRNLTALLFKYNGKMILIDCGEGTQVPMKSLGWGFKSIEAICFTHYHADHIVGLPGLLLTLGNSGREEPLTIFGPPNLLEVVKGLTVIAPQLPFDIKLVELSDEASTMINFGDIVINSLPVEHSIPCLAYSLEVKRAGKFDVQKAKKDNIPMKIWSSLQKGVSLEFEGQVYTPEMVLGEDRKGLKISYCTDTRPIDSIRDFVRDSDLLISEGMYGAEDMLDKAIEKKHMLFSEAATLAKNSNSKELWLTHYSPALNEPEEYLDSTKEIFNNTQLGKDIMTKTLNFVE